MKAPGRKFLSFFFFSFLICSNGWGATVYSVSSGSWTSSSTWNCHCVPATTDEAKISAGTTVTIPNSSQSITNLIIEATATFDNSNKNFSVLGNYTNNGTHKGTGGDLYLKGDNAIVSGTGVINNTGVLYITGLKTTIASGSSLVRNGSVSISQQVINQSTFTINGNLTGASATSVWQNDVNSTLKIKGSLLTAGILDADATGNTLIYTGTTQNVYPTEYYHLQIAGTLTKTLLGNTIVSGNLTIDSKLDASASSYKITLKGDFINNGTFVERLGTVVFTGGNFQNITATSDQTFYNLSVDKSAGDVTLNRKSDVKGVLTLTSGNINTSSTNLLTVKSSGSTSGGSAASFVNGPLAHEGSGIKIYPIGKSTLYRPVEFIVAGTSPVISFEFFNATTTGSLPDGVCLIKNHHWSAKLISGTLTNAAPVKLSFGPEENVSAIEKLAVLKRDAAGTTFVNLGNSAYTGTSLNGTVTSNPSLAISLPAIFALGQQANAIPAISHIQIIQTQREFQKLYYQVPTYSDVVYEWVAEGGVVDSGQGTNTIYTVGNILSLKLNLKNVCGDAGADITEVRSLSVGPENNEILESPNFLGAIAPVPGATNYVIEYSTDPTFTNKFVSIPNGETDNYGILFPRYKNVTCLESSQTFYVRVKANNNTGYGMVTTFHTGKPKAILAQPKAYTSDNEPNVRAKASFACNADKYTFDINEKSDFTGAGITFSTPTNTGNILALDYGKKYFARIKANDGSILGDWSKTYYFYTKAFPVTNVITPADSAVNVNRAARIYIASQYNADLYEWEISSSPIFAPSQTITFTTTVANAVKGSLLHNGTKYYVRIKCHVSSQNIVGDWGPVTTFTTSGIAPASRQSFNANPSVNETENSILIFPNPGSTQATIKIDYAINAAGTKVIQLFNSQGEEIARQEIIDNSGQLTLKDLYSNSLIPGIYFVRISSDEMSIKEQIIIH